MSAHWRDEVSIPKGTVLYNHKQCDKCGEPHKNVWVFPILDVSPSPNEVTHQGWCPSGAGIFMVRIEPKPEQ